MVGAAATAAVVVETVFSSQFFVGRGAWSPNKHLSGHPVQEMWDYENYHRKRRIGSKSLAGSVQKDTPRSC